MGLGFKALGLTADPKSLSPEPYFRILNTKPCKLSIRSLLVKLCGICGTYKFLSTEVMAMALLIREVAYIRPVGG